jgi:hypothetical protein
LSTLTITNKGSFEAKEVVIIYEDHDSNSIKKYQKIIDILHPESKISLKFKGIKDRAVLILYKNILTDKCYITGGIIKFNRKHGESAISPFTDQTKITQIKFAEITRLVYLKNHYPLEILEY